MEVDRHAGRGVSSVCLVIVDRANWGRVQPLAQAIRDRGLHLSIVCAGSTAIARFGHADKVIEADGFIIAERLFNEIDSDSPLAKAKSGGLMQYEFAACLSRLTPDVVIVVGDRYQAVPAALAAIGMNIRLIHIQGGEISGSLDERYRHMLTKAADYHVPATERTRDNLIRMGERPESILAVGCPSADLAAKVAGGEPLRPYVLVCYHPDTTCGERAGDEMREVLSAVDRIAIDAKLLWPNIDAFSGDVAKRIRQWLEMPGSFRWQTIKNLSPLDYAQTLASAACAVGNSSSFVRDAGYFGTPVVLVGDRQQGRERGENVTPVPANVTAICGAIQSQLSHGRYQRSHLYGTPGISQRIVEKLLTLEPYGQKRLAYAEQPQEALA